jgi:ribosomal protein L16 Arg81 hydroxylase
LLAGRVKTFYGPCLEKSVINQTGDFLFIPAGFTHMPVNLSASEAAIAIVARNDANEQEHVELHAPPGKAESTRYTNLCSTRPQIAIKACSIGGNAAPPRWAMG